VPASAAIPHCGKKWCGATFESEYTHPHEIVKEFCALHNARAGQKCPVLPHCDKMRLPPSPPVLAEQRARSAGIPRNKGMVKSGPA
jgi:hypothetical protein